MAGPGLLPPDPNAPNPKPYRPRNEGRQASAQTPEDAAATSAAAAAAMEKQKLANGATPGSAPISNFDMSPQAAAEIRAAQARGSERFDGNPLLQNLSDARAREDAAQVASQEQARRGGVEVTQANMQAGGIGGFFDPNAKVQTEHYTAGRVDNTSLAGNRAQLNALADAAANRGNATMEGATIQGTTVGPGATIATGMQDQQRARQNALLDQLMAASNGQGPSAAQQQLKMGADRNMANALAMAAAAGTPGAQRQAAFQRAAITQDAAGQAAILRAQEINDARGLLGQVAQGARAQDIGLATDQANLAQQAQLTQASLDQQTRAAQAGLTQDAAKTNLLSAIEQQKQRDALVQSYVAQGMSLDQAQYQAELQQAQFNAELLARQAAADKGVAMQSSAQGGQMVGAGMAALGTVLAGAASASDERVKENVADADKSVEKFLDGIAAKEWDYKDPKKHGEGRRTGVMAQAAEKNSDMVFTHTDGVKMIDHGKAISTSLAALANINKRLRKVENA